MLRGRWFPWLMEEIMAASVRVLKDERKSSGWVIAIVNGRYCQAKVYSEGSVYGINEGRVSKLCVSSGKAWKGLSDTVYNYDRGLDKCELPQAEVDAIVAAFESMK